MWFARWRWYHVLLAWLIFVIASVLLVCSVFRVAFRAQSGSGSIVVFELSGWPLLILATALAVMIALTIGWARSR